MSLVVRSTRVVTAEGMRPASVIVANGRITRVAGWQEVQDDNSLVDVGDLVVMPGLIDTHVHVNEPGRTEWEGFETATRAAAAGGVTTILDMPLNSIPATTTVAALDAKKRAAEGKCAVNVEYIGGVVPGNSHDIPDLASAGVRAFKCFLTPSGVSEFEAVTEADLRQALPLLAKCGLPLMVHAENPDCLIESATRSRKYADYLESRPVTAERSAIEMLIRLMEECPARIHIVHLSSANSLDLIRNARAEGLPLTVETCPHYLTFASEDIPDGATEYKCAPPIRNSAEREGLWAALIAGEIDLIASDHSPCPSAMKDTGGDFFAAWGGIASLQLALPAVWTGAHARGAGPREIAEWMCVGTGKLAGLDGRKGKVAEGYDADLVVWDPEALFKVDASRLFHRHPLTPYDGMTLRGVVRATYVGGVKVFADEASRP